MHFKDYFNESSIDLKHGYYLDKDVETIYNLVVDYLMAPNFESTKSTRFTDYPDLEYYKRPSSYEKVLELENGVRVKITLEPVDNDRATASYGSIRTARTELDQSWFDNYTKKGLAEEQPDFIHIKIPHTLFIKVREAVKHKLSNVPFDHAYKLVYTWAQNIKSVIRHELVHLYKDHYLLNYRKGTSKFVKGDNKYWKKYVNYEDEPEAFVSTVWQDILNTKEKDPNISFTDALKKSYYLSKVLHRDPTLRNYFYKKLYELWKAKYGR